MGQHRPVTVFIVDDDAVVRRSLERLLRTYNYRSWSFSSAAEFLAAHDPEVPGCIILDLAMPELGGLEVQERLKAKGRQQPIIFLTGKGDISTSVRAMRAGAVNFLTKPVEEKQLLPAVEEAVHIDSARRNASSLRSDVERRLATLTRRERQVMSEVVKGRMNKQIAGELGTVEKTIKVHRARAMQKMGARSLAELVQLADCVNMGEPLPFHPTAPSSFARGSAFDGSPEGLKSRGDFLNASE